MFRKFVLTLFLFITICAGGFAVSERSAAAQDLTPEERAALQAQYDELQKEIALQQQIIKDTQAKKNTLQGDVTLLDAQIKEAQAQINAKNITIKQLSAQIVKKNTVIGQLSDRIERGKESLASILRQTQMLDDYSTVSVALGSQSVSGFFSDLDAFTSLKTSLQNLFADIRTAKAQTESEKAELAVRQDQTIDAKYIVEAKQKQVSSDKKQKQQLLAITASQETEYKKVLAERQAKAAAIRAALFPLRDAAAIQFIDALNYAKKAQARTGVRPALILAVLTQESNLGKNVGQCFLRNTVTGAGVGRNTGTVFPNVMAPTRDVPPFLDLGERLGFDSLNQVVSCPIQSAGGWGGAMGPAQFIPSTWRTYEARVAATTGHSVPSPWSAEDAIAAMSLYLGDLGADAGGYSAERRAAAKYYAGGAWAGRQGQFYGASVLALAESIQSNIDFLSNN
ncbi:lytic murein transglycosylase [Candidatus Kaiserbacteria bacterium]|nr:lytic murein transglycosylase [Candidatus Kaiserbacteria bacterium]